MIYNKDITKSFVRITTFQLSGYERRIIKDRIDMITTFFEEELGFKKKGKDYYKELVNSYIFLNLQKSKFANDYFVNIGIVYKR